MATWTPRLSKSRFQAGLQCPKYLWLQCRAPQLADPVSEAKQAIFDQGHAVGELARQLFPGGVLVAEDYTQTDQAMETTQCLIGDGAGCLYEAAFRYDGVLVRPDALFKEDDHSWTLVEVKSSTEVKPEHITDLGIQAYVLRGAGVPVGSMRLLHLNNDYVYPGGPYDLGQLFTLEDVTAQVEPFIESVPGLLRQFRQMLAGPMPEIADQPALRQPVHLPLPRLLPRATCPSSRSPRSRASPSDVLCSLLGDGYCSIREVPLDYPGLTPAQRTVCDVIQTGEARFDPELKNELSRLSEPIHFLDFETWRSALPVFPQTRPYQALPVQWSLHTLDGGSAARRVPPHRRHRPAAAIHHRACSRRWAPADGQADDSPIVVYTGYESRILDDLARDLPEFAAPIAASPGPSVRPVQGHQHLRPAPRVPRQLLAQVRPAGAGRRPLLRGPGRPERRGRHSTLARGHLRRRSGLGPRGDLRRPARLLRNRYTGYGQAVRGAAAGGVIRPGARQREEPHESRSGAAGRLRGGHSAGGKLIVCGIFDRITLADLDAVHPHMALALKLAATRRETRLITSPSASSIPTGSMWCPRWRVTLKSRARLSGDASVNLILDLNLVKFGTAGPHSFDIFLDGKLETAGPADAWNGSSVYTT